MVCRCRYSSAFCFFLIFLDCLSICLVLGGKFHVNRYFLQIDNVFDYKKEHVLNSLPPNKSYELFVEEDYVKQPIDHFDPLENRHFWQKYLLQPNLKRCGTFCSKTPICVFIGGDAAVDNWWMDNVFLAERCAEEFGGHLFLLEHRFYGESIPNENMTLDYLKYLTVSQALEDISGFIIHVRKKFKLEKNKLFVFGASYGGTLAALFRRKYSHLTDAAVAMSAPMVKEYQDKEYLASIGKKIKKTNQMCFKFIELGLRQATRLMDNHICAKKDLPMCDKIKENLGLCSSLKGMTKQERRIFFTSLIKDFAFLVEYNGVLDVTLTNICDVMTHGDIQDWSPMDKLLAGDIVISQELFRSKMRAGLGLTSGDCLHSKKQAICDYFQNSSAVHESVTTGRRQRLWQSCTELGSFRTSNGDARQHPFGGVEVLPGGFHQEFCECAFGETFTQSYTQDRLRAYHKTFGTFLPSSTNASPYNAGSRIIYTIGEDDPTLQRELKLAEKPGMKVKYTENVIFKVKDSSHCGEVFLKQSRRKRMKPKPVSVVQQEILEQLAEWLKNS